MSAHVNPVPYCFGFSTAATLAAFWECVTKPTTLSAVAFAGSAVATALGWLIARRSELQHAAIELERERRQAIRDEKLADVLLELRIQQAKLVCKAP